MSRGPVGVGIAAIVLGVAGLGVFLATSRPTIPAGAASTPMTRIVLTGDVRPDPTEGPEPTGDVDPEVDALPPSPAGQDCLDRVSRGTGWADLCWAGSRYLQEADPEKDYYVLRVYGSFESLRWLVARVQLVGQPGDGVFVGWPKGLITGACQTVPVDLMGLQVPGLGEVCGRTEGETSHGPWFHAVTWTCEQCLLPDDATRPMTLVNSVGVPKGTVPSWDLFIDAGS